MYLILTDLAKSFRVNRIKHFLSLLEHVPKPVRILDVGGTENYWEQVGLADNFQAKVTVVSLSPFICRHCNFTSVVSDARNLGFEDKSFDVVFSNSAIEHVGSFDDQHRMSQEIRRIGCRYYVQTPNRYFPIEPHFLIPLFQFYPQWLKVWVVTNIGFSLTYGRLEHRRPASATEARRLVSSVRLLTKTEVRQLFPEAQILCERVGPLNKSYIAYYGWEKL